MSPLFSVVVLNWNAEDYLAQCLESLDRQQLQDFELIVVDNASRDGSRGILERQSDRTVLVLLDQNLGYCGGNNRGIARARGSLIVLLNSDAVVDPGWLAALAAAAERHPEAGMFASKIYSLAEPHRFDSVGLLVYPDGVCRSRGWMEVDLGQYDKEEEVLGPNGAAACYRRSMLEETGIFDERYFAYLEDLDLALRGQLMNYRCVFVPDAVVYHQKSASSGKHSKFKAFHVERNRIWNLLKLFPWRLVLVSPAFTTYRYLLQAFAAVTNKGASGGFVRDHSRLELLGVLLRANASALRGAPAVLRERAVLRKRRRVDSRGFLRVISRFKLPAIELALKD